MSRFEGKTALITGGARGIGKVIAERFAAEGARLALCDVDMGQVSETAREFTNKGYAASAYEMNVADEESVKGAVKAVMDDAGQIDILINNAGITRDGLMLRMKRADWDSVIAVNLTGTFLVTQAVVRHMVKARFGRIINIASVVGLIGNAGQVNYSASKAGIIGMTKTMAKEYAARGVTVNAIAPGYIETEMTAILTDEARQAFLKAVPLNRPGSPDDVASATIFLASDDASYMTGQVLSVDGGMYM